MALRRLGELLVQQKIVTQKQLDSALKQQKPNERLGETLIRLGVTSEMQVLRALEASTGVERISLNTYPIEEKSLALVDEAFCRRYDIIPLKVEDNALFFATPDPLDFAVIEELRLLTGYRPKAYSSPRNDIRNLIEKYYGFKRSLEGLGIRSGNMPDEKIDSDDSDDTPMVKLVNQILTSAVLQHASDIHIDPLDEKVYVRYRVDGVLDTVREFPIKLLSQMVNRIKVMSGLNITETRLPQDGRLQTIIQQRSIDLRISTLPTVRGEKIVMRILDLSGNISHVNTLGLDPREEKIVRDMIKRPNGIVLVSGPTGSGKTTTLYAFLNELNKPNVNIITVEDPVEVKMVGVNQVQVHPEINLTFASALRSILRQDPNIVMIGEIRDIETAEIAIRASLTGHLVLSTIHTNSAAKTITRLLDMKIEPYLLASSMSGIIAQRLVRRLCPECAVQEDPNATEKALIEKHNFVIPKLWRARGCPSCNYKGFVGRVGIFEIMPLSHDVQELIAGDAKISEIEQKARDGGMLTILEAGLQKVKEGVTTMEEVLKVASD